MDYFYVVLFFVCIFILFARYCSVFARRPTEYADLPIATTIEVDDAAVVEVAIAVV